MTDRDDADEEKDRLREGDDRRFRSSFYRPFDPPEPWLFPTALYRPFIEVQRGLLVWYRDQLQRHARDDGFDDRLREALNALVMSWLGAVESLREQREHSIRLQSELVTRYLDVLDEFLDRTDDGEP